LYVDGYTNLSENCNKSTCSPVTFGSVLGLQVTVGLQIYTGLQPPTRREPYVAGTMLRRPEPTKEGVEPTIFSIIAIEITHLSRFALLLLVRIQR